MIPEYVYQIIIGFLFIGFVFAVTYIMLSRNPTPTPEETINPRDDEMENITKQLHEGMVSQATANEGFRKQLRENFMENEDQKTIIVDLRAMIVTKNANIELKAGKIGLQAGLAIVSAHEIETLRKMIELQEITIRGLEARLAATLKDGYGEHGHSFAQDSMESIP